MSRMIRLIPPKGTTGFSHGGEHFEAEDDGTVLAATYAVDALCRVGGFALAPGDVPPSPPPAASHTASVGGNSVADDPPTKEVAAATAVSPMLPRLVIPNPVAVPLGRVSSDG